MSLKYMCLYCQANGCSFSGRLDSDPNSTVHISGCLEKKETVDISIVSEKVDYILYIHIGRLHESCPQFLDKSSEKWIKRKIVLLSFFLLHLLATTEQNHQDQLIFISSRSFFQSKLQFNIYRVEKTGKQSKIVNSLKNPLILHRKDKSRQKLNFFRHNHTIKGVFNFMTNLGNPVFEETRPTYNIIRIRLYVGLGLHNHTMKGAFNFMINFGNPVFEGRQYIR